jgi:hypothetical protein
VIKKSLQSFELCVGVMAGGKKNRLRKIKTVLPGKWTKNDVPVYKLDFNPNDRLSTTFALLAVIEFYITMAEVERAGGFMLKYNHQKIPTELVNKMFDSFIQEAKVSHFICGDGFWELQAREETPMTGTYGDYKAKFQ